MELTLGKVVSIMKHEVKNQYALAYINALPEAVEFGGSSLYVTADEALFTQVLYIQANLSTWRGDTARQCKVFLKNWIKDKRKELA